jgi:transcriptional regulator with XRE-family HTH domain
VARPVFANIGVYVACVAKEDDGGPWSRRLTTQVGQQVKAHRRRRGWSARELADRCEDLGQRVEPQVIANMETGRRANVTIAEVVILAAALDVPPVLLIFPARTDQTVEPLPNREDNAWSSLLRFTGEREPLGRNDASPDGDELRVWWDGVMPMTRLREHDEAIGEFWGAVEYVRRMEAHQAATEGQVSDELLEERRGRAMDQVIGAERRLAAFRGQLRAQGIEPPALGHDLAHIDDLKEARP